MAKKSVKRTAVKPVAKKTPRPANRTAKPQASAKAARPSADRKSARATTSATQAPNRRIKPQGVNGKPLTAPKRLAPAARTESPKKVPATATTIPVKAPAAPAGKNGKSVAAAAAPVEAPKPSGKPMLTQGPFASKTLTKKGTFAPLKTLPPAPKVVVKRKVERLEPQFVIVQPPVAAVATSEKAAKNKAGLNQRDLDTFRDLLLAKRRELLGDMSSMEREALRENNANLSNLPVHMADQGTDAYEQEFTLGLVEKDRTLLREINDALAKIQNGTYGICEGTGDPISKARLEAQPWARHSIEYARLLEKRKMMFRR